VVSLSLVKKKKEEKVNGAGYTPKINNGSQFREVETKKELGKSPKGEKDRAP